MSVPRETKSRCHMCNDTGRIDTGNNDLPCSCPAGDSALFNVAGCSNPMTGAELRRYLGIDTSGTATSADDRPPEK